MEIIPSIKIKNEQSLLQKFKTKCAGHKKHADVFTDIHWASTFKDCLI